MTTIDHETQTPIEERAEPFDPITEATIRQHRLRAAARPAGEMQPLATSMTTTFQSISVGQRIHTTDRLMWPTTTPPAICDEPACPHCEGAGFYKEAVAFGHPNFGRLFPCVCKLAEQEQRRRAEQQQMLATLENGMGWLASARLNDFSLTRPLDPSVTWCGVTADRAQQAESLARALDDARGYVARPQGGIFICGPNGAGKSLLAAAILAELARASPSVGYESAPKLLRFIQAGFKDKSADERMDALLAVDLLLIDDLGSETGGDWNQQTLFEILDTRYKQRRRTLITSNLRRKDLAMRLASRIADMVDLEIWLVVSDLREIRLRERNRLREQAA